MRSLHRAAQGVATLLLSSFASVVFAQAATTTTSTATTAAPSATPVFGLMQGVFGLLVVLGLIFAAGWLMKKVGPRGRTSGMVQVMGGASVGPREKVVVVRFGTQTLLLGVAPGHVGLLHVAGATDAAGPASPAPVAGDAAPDFAQSLRSARGGA